MAKKRVQALYQMFYTDIHMNNICSYTKSERLPLSLLHIAMADDVHTVPKHNTKQFHPTLREETSQIQYVALAVYV